MKRTLLFVLCTFFALALTAKSVTPATSLPTYYKDIDGKAGKSLFDAVQKVTKLGYSSLGYDGLWDAYPYTDVHENGYVWDMYSDCTWKSINSNHCGNYSDECDCYNREHSIPKSWYGGTTSGPGCDIFHLVPTDGKVNGIRSNYPFGEVSSADYNKHGNKKGSAKSITITGGNTIAGNTGATISASGTVFEPRDEYKGDFARGYMGALLKWAGDKAFTEGEGSKTFTTNFSTGSFGLTKYGVALLMKWHRQDPVSQKEVDRNNGIQQTQGNRNPFIDYPYLAEYIWGEKAGETLNLADLITAYDSRFVLGESNGYLKGGSTVDPETKCTITWLVNGEAYTAGNPTTTVNEGGVVSVLPTAPKSCDEISTQFVGWSEEVIEGTQDNVPTDLFSTPDDAPDITQNTTFHAVFALVEEDFAPAGDPMVYTLTMTDTEGWTLSGLIKDSKHWRMVTNSYIELQEEIDASQIQYVIINMRTYGGANYNTIEFKVGNTKVGELVASNKTLNDYVWKAETPISAVGKLRFTSTKNTSEYGPALSSIEVDMKGPSYTYTYSRYITSCNNQSSDVEETIVAKPNTKIIRNGQLLIEYNGVYYNTLGQPIK
ncbi:MAG: endonuclease [Paludibacteraceae bacterium]|nr:endonuclease [Paludibacteraceae bacterium]